MNKQTEIPIACDLNALTAAERARRRTLVGALAQAIVGRAELDHGFELRVDSTELELPALAEWIALERRCCPFLQFRIELAPGNGPVTVALSGGEGVKDFLRAEMGLP
ncbi:MAG: hypothetical protein JO121_08665 [Deltaproteobacteria bacterium]|nr:hypothetical protein [Deltaproteobacteria bacterium]